jgi:prolyl-tRNA synthetase
MRRGHSGFVLMSTHEEAMTALNSAHGQSFR